MESLKRKFLTRIAKILKKTGDFVGGELFTLGKYKPLAKVSLQLNYMAFSIDKKYNLKVWGEF